MTAVTLTELMFTVLASLLLAASLFFRHRRRMGQRTDVGSDHAVPSVGFLHPSAGGGGGGERVLWIALRTLLQSDARCGIRRQYTLYTKRYAEPLKEGSEERRPESADAARRDDQRLLRLVEQQFGISPRDLQSPQLRIVYLRHTTFLDPSHYPRFTLILQSLIGGLAMFHDVAMCGATDVIVDTVGIPFSYPLLRLLCGCTIATYTHYPVISTDMIELVARRGESFNNGGLVARNALLSALKLRYYRAFAGLYRVLGGNWATAVLTNSTWTDNHIRRLWKRQDTHIVFPPCDVAAFASAAEDTASSDARHNTVISVGQFRPEKNHALQIAAFARALRDERNIPADTKLYLVGGVRNKEDEARAQRLRDQIAALGLLDAVTIEINAPQSRVLELLSHATVGIHTMRDEHFGIVVAEYMAAGCVAVAHNTGGPRHDIVDPGRTGFLCDTEAEYADALAKAFALRRDPQAWLTFTNAAKASAARFSDQHFAREFCARLAPVLALTLLPDEDDDGVKLCC